jgi:hypothetical protein
MRRILLRVLRMSRILLRVVLHRGGGSLTYCFGVFTSLSTVASGLLG